VCANVDWPIGQPTCVDVRVGRISGWMAVCRPEERQTQCLERPLQSRFGTNAKLRRRQLTVRKTNSYHPKLAILKRCFKSIATNFGTHSASGIFDGWHLAPPTRRDVPVVVIASDLRSENKTLSGLPPPPPARAGQLRGAKEAGNEQKRTTPAEVRDMQIKPSALSRMRLIRAAARNQAASASWRKPRRPGAPIS